MNNVDLYIFNLFHSLVGQTFWVDVVIYLFAQYVPIIVIGIVFSYTFYFASLRKKKTSIKYITSLISASLSLIVLMCIRYIYPHPRPFVALDFSPLFMETSSSFPSGHATFFFALSTSIYFINKRLGKVFYGITILISLARISAGVHYPSDIVGGAILGVFTASILFYLAKRWLPRKQRFYFDK